MTEKSGSEPIYAHDARALWMKLGDVEKKVDGLSSFLQDLKEQHIRSEIERQMSAKDAGGKEGGKKGTLMGGATGTVVTIIIYLLTTYLESKGVVIP